MPFDPKLVHADEPPLAADGDLNLPSDLSALVQQLGDDAMHLAACYPAAASARMAPARIRRSATVASICGMALAAFFAGAFAVWQSASPVADTRSGARPLPPQFISTSAPSNTTISLTELSAPEVEALLDLMQRDPKGEVSVSF